MGVLLRKLLRDVGVGLFVVGLLLAAFECLWAQVAGRILEGLAPFLSTLASYGGLSFKEVEQTVFEGPGEVIRTLLGGENIALDNAMDLLSIGYVHPLVQMILCIWAVGRASGALAGELDRGTLELLLAQPLSRSRLVLAHLGVDLIVIPILCLCLWCGNVLGYWMAGPYEVHPPELKKPPPRVTYLVELGPFKVQVKGPSLKSANSAASPQAAQQRLQVHLADFGPALLAVAGLLFALSGATMALSAAGRFRWRVLGLAIVFFLVQFLVNVIGQMWDTVAFLRPLTIFYYYQPQQVILGQSWSVTFAEWNHGRPLCHVPLLVVLFGVGAIGYALALRTFCRRDLPAPL